MNHVADGPAWKFAPRFVHIICIHCHQLQSSCIITPALCWVRCKFAGWGINFAYLLFITFLLYFHFTARWLVLPGILMVCWRNWECWILPAEPREFTWRFGGRQCRFTWKQTHNYPRDNVCCSEPSCCGSAGYRFQCRYISCRWRFLLLPHLPLRPLLLLRGSFWCEGRKPCYGNLYRTVVGLVAITPAAQVSSAFCLVVGVVTAW